MCNQPAALQSFPLPVIDDVIAGSILLVEANQEVNAPLRVRTGGTGTSSERTILRLSTHRASASLEEE